MQFGCFCSVISDQIITAFLPLDGNAQSEIFGKSRVRCSSHSLDEDVLLLRQQREHCIKKMWKPSLERISIFRKRLLFSLCNAVSPNFRRHQGSCVSSDCTLYLFKHWQTKEDLILFCYPSYILHPFVWAVLGLKTALGNPIVKMKCLDSGFRKKKKGSLQECVDFGFPGVLILLI